MRKRKGTSLASAPLSLYVTGEVSVVARGCGASTQVPLLDSTSLSLVEHSRLDQTEAHQECSWTCMCWSSYLLLRMFAGICIGVDELIADVTAESAQRVAKKDSGVLPCAR